MKNETLANTALAHLSMIVQIAQGRHKPKPGELEGRAAVIAGFIRTGEMPPSEIDRELVQQIGQWLSQKAA